MSDDATVKIILARHGEATYRDEADSGERDGTLTALGEDQARELGLGLRRRDVSAVVCSDLSRARQTATIAADILGLDAVVRPGLHEYRLGDEPYNIESLGSALLGWLGGDRRARVLGGESGEEVAERVFNVLDDLVRDHAGQTVLVVTHGGVILAALGRICPGRTGLPTAGNPHNLETDLTGGTAFWLEHRSGDWQILPRPGKE